MGLSTNLQSLNLTFDVDGKQLTVTSAQISFAANGIPRASVELAVGRVNGFIDAGSIRGVTYGAPCTINGDDGVIFNGLVLDVYPRVIAADGETVSIVVEMLGRTAKLNTGTRTTSPLIPADFSDKSVFCLLSGDAGAKLREFLLDNKNLDLVDNIKKALTKIMGVSGDLETDTSKFARAEFGDVNKEFVSTMEEVRGMANWKWSQGSYEVLTNSLSNYLFLDDSMGKTILENLKDVCDQLRLSFIEFGDILLFVPHSPFYTSDEAYQMGGAEYSELSMEPIQRKNMLMGTIVFSGSNKKPIILPNTRPPGVYKLSTDHPLGAILGATPPAFIGGKLNTDAGAKEEPGTVINEEDLQAGFGDEWAKFLTYNALYADRRVKVTCPYVRTDIAPLTAIRIDYPLDREIGDMLPSKYIYGVVNSITISVDPSAEVAQTTFTIDYVRSDLEQERIDADYTGHPFFDANWVGTT